MCRVPVTAEFTASAHPKTPLYGAGDLEQGIPCPLQNNAPCESQPHTGCSQLLPPMVLQAGEGLRPSCRRPGSGACGPCSCPVSQSHGARGAACGTEGALCWLCGVTMAIGERESKQMEQNPSQHGGISGLRVEVWLVTAGGLWVEQRLIEFRSRSWG